VYYGELSSARLQEQRRLQGQDAPASRRLSLLLAGGMACRISAVQLQQQHEHDQRVFSFRNLEFGVTVARSFLFSN